MTALDDATTDAFAIGTALNHRGDADAALYIGTLLAEKSRFEVGRLVAAQQRVIRNLLIVSAEELGCDPDRLWMRMAVDFQQQLADRSVDR